MNRVERYDAPPRITPTARTYLRAWARVSSGATARRLRAITRTQRPAALRRLADQLQAGPWGELYDGLIRNIFVPTIVDGGFRANVLPGTAQATVNMRMLPGQKPRPLIARLRRVVDDPKVEITPIVTGDATVEETLDTFDKRAEQPPSRIDTDLYRSLVREGRRQWPGRRGHAGAVRGRHRRDAVALARDPRLRDLSLPDQPRRPEGDARQRRADRDPEPRAGHRHGHAGAAGRGRVARGSTVVAGGERRGSAEPSRAVGA